MRVSLLFPAFLALSACSVSNSTPSTETTSLSVQSPGNPAADNIFGFTLNDIDGKPVQLETFKGKVLILVNVASQCGYTPQYETLQEFYNQYRDRGVVVLGFPANNFGGQEPGSEAQIKEFCTRKFNVTFPMFSKISVKGSDMHPLYQYLTSATGQEVKWNFQKFLVGKDGKVIRSYPSGTDVLSEEVIGEVEGLL